MSDDLELARQVGTWCARALAAEADNALLRDTLTARTAALDRVTRQNDELRATVTRVEAVIAGETEVDTLTGRQPRRVSISALRAALRADE